MADGAGAGDAPHVVLVGLMGAGKSTVGRALAARLGRAFVDVDDEVERRAGCTVAELFGREGEAGFRAREADAVADVLAAPDPGVVATGGGAVLCARTREALTGQATVWLRATPEVLAERLGATPGVDRPLLVDGDPVARLARLAEEREPLYHDVAGIVVDVGGLSVDEVLDRILDSALARSLPEVAS